MSLSTTSRASLVRRSRAPRMYCQPRLRDTAHQWGELAPDAPHPCANIVLNLRRPVARHLDRAGLQRLGAALDRTVEHGRAGA